MKITNEDQKILDEAHKYFRTLWDASSHLRDSFVKSMKFSFNIAEGHWDYSDLADRDEKKRAHITAHKLGKFVTSVINNERGMPNRDQVVPVDDAGDKNIATIYNYLINDIEYHSKYDEVTTLAGEHAVGGGFGYWRLLTEYEPDGLDQVLRIKPIKNPLNVFLDERGRRAFIREGMSIDEFEETWPDFKEIPTDFENFADYTLWYEDDKVFISEYFRRVPVKKVIAEVKDVNGQLIVVDVTDKEDQFEIIRSRETNDFKVEWYKLCGHAILERGEWVGNEIPIIEVVGQEVHLEGKTYKKSLGKDVEDINRALDYWFTSLTEKVALSPKAPYLVTPQQIQGFEAQWDTANTELHPYLLYKQTPSGVPARASSPEVGAGELTMLNICDSYIRDILGMYESSMGAPSNERSGRAIQARASQSNLTNFHFPDNLRKARLKTKKMIIDAIPKVYNNERSLRLIGKSIPTTINKETFDIERGEKVIVNDLSVGKYDIRASNPMNPTIRQRAEESLRDYMQYVPTHADIILPVALSFSDIPGSDKLLEAISQRSQQIQAAAAAKNAGQPALPM